MPALTSGRGLPINRSRGGAVTPSLLGGTPSEFLSFRGKAQSPAPTEASPSAGATHLIKHASDQTSKQAAKRVDHDGPEKVQHRHHLLPDDVPTPQCYGKVTEISTPQAPVCRMLKNPEI